MTEAQKKECLLLALTDGGRKQNRRKPSGEAKFEEEISSRRASNVFNHQNYGVFTATQLVSKGPRQILLFLRLIISSIGMGKFLIAASKSAHRK